MCPLGCPLSIAWLPRRRSPSIDLNALGTVSDGWLSAVRTSDVVDR
jgi:hypothetical protein